MPAMNRSSRSRLLVGLLGLGLLALALSVWLWWRDGHGKRSDGAAATAASQAAQAQAPGQASSAPRSLAELRAFLAQGALQGLKLAGNWCNTAEDGLKPCAALRDRFEYYLNAASVVPPLELRSLVEDDAKRANGVAVANQLVVVYDRYLAVRDYTYQKPLDLNDTELWAAALDERHQVRWQGMGADWAQAFFGAEERAARTELANAKEGRANVAANQKPVPRPAGQVKPGQTAPGAGTTAAELEQMRVTQKIEDVRDEWKRLDSDASLSNDERMAQLKRFVEQHVDPKDQNRVMTFARMRKP